MIDLIDITTGVREGYINSDHEYFQNIALSNICSKMTQLNVN